MSIIVIGGGPAGMMAAVAASQSGQDVVLVDHQKNLGRKLMITGKGRCNITNQSDKADFLDKISQSFFCHSAFHQFFVEDLMDMMTQAGCPLKVERGQRVFPVSDKAKDVLGVFLDKLKEGGVQIRRSSPVKEIMVREGRVRGVRLKTKEELAGRVILATGGMSYPQTGSDGSGYGLARALGHRLIKPLPSLVGLRTKEAWSKSLAGLSLKNVSLSYRDKKKTPSFFGEMLFTHQGISGPIVLTASRNIVRLLDEKGPLTLSLDLKPALDKKQIQARMIREIEAHSKKDLTNLLRELLPLKLIGPFLSLSGLDGRLKAHQLTKAGRKRLEGLFKDLPLTVLASEGFKSAVVTQGGIDLKEIDPSTMASKQVSGLYFAGEILDLDGPTGGYNLQIAFSTGYVAGAAAAREEAL